MTDAIFQPNPPPAPEAPPSRRQSPKKGKNKGGRPRKVVEDFALRAQFEAEGKGAVDTSRKVSTTSRRKARSVKIDLAVAMTALSGLTEDDSKFLTGVIQAMQAFSAAQRRRIVGALSKVFA
jgi:hypothetical protein